MDCKEEKSKTPLPIHRHLPEPIVEEILSRLSVKPLLRFKSVCKSWCSRISSRGFIKTHLEISSKDKSLSRHRLVAAFREGTTFRECSLQSLFSVEEQTRYFPLQNPVNDFQRLIIVGSCNGLICLLVDGSQFLFWNPSTRESKKLPDYEEQGFVSKYGFGFDESSGDYKVYATFGGHDYYKGIGKVYSLKNNSWGRSWLFDDFSTYDYATDKLVDGKLVGGRLHWSRDGGLNSRWNILYLDFNKESLGFVDQPNSVSVEVGFHLTIGVFEGCLCMLCDYPRNRVDVWIWKDYGVEDSWTKWITIPYGCIPWHQPHLSIPLWVSQDGDVLFTDNRSLVIYHQSHHWFSHPWIVRFKNFLGVHIYAESLVSPHLVDV